MIRRAALIGMGSGAGALAGALVWVLLAGRSAEVARLRFDQDELAHISLSQRTPPLPTALIADAINHPVFALTTGPGATPDISAGIRGLARAGDRRAALVSINGGDPRWLERGISSGGLTVLDVSPTKVLLDTPFGRRGFTLGQEGPVSNPAAALASPSPVARDEIPKGVRLPPPPAAAD